MSLSPKNNSGTSRVGRSLLLLGVLLAAGFVLVMLRRWLRGRNPPQRGQRGFTLIETVLAVIIISLIGTVVIRAIDTNARADRTLDEQVQATNLVTAYLENMRQLAYDDSANAYASVGANITKPTQYAVGVGITYGHLDGSNLEWSTDNHSGDYKLQKISISVTRTTGKPVLTTCTYRAKR